MSNMSKVSKIALVAILGTQLGACATLFGDGSQTVNVRASNNAEFTARLEDGTQFKVPGAVGIKKRDSQPVKILSTEKGCTSVTEIDRQIDGVFWLNVISGGALGSGTDYVTGNMWDYDTNTVIACAN